MVHLTHSFIYPIKSLDGVKVNQATVLACGALKGDREFAIVDYQGKFVNGKRTTAVHQLRSEFNLAARTVAIRIQDGQPASFHLDCDRISLESWLGDYFGFPVKLIQNSEMGFPDDTDSPGPTFITIETLQEVASWFPDLSMENVRSRLRTNFELAAPEPFWEERLYSQAGHLVPFRLGSVQFLGVNPCQRCIVPTRDAITGAAYPDFQKTFIANRKSTLPPWVDSSRFNHYYRLAINTRCPASESGKTIQINDSINLEQA